MPQVILARLADEIARIKSVGSSGAGGAPGAGGAAAGTQGGAQQAAATEALNKQVRSSWWLGGWVLVGTWLGREARALGRSANKRLRRRDATPGQANAHACVPFSPAAAATAQVESLSSLMGQLAGDVRGMLGRVDSLAGQLATVTLEQRTLGMRMASLPGPTSTGEEGGEGGCTRRAKWGRMASQGLRDGLHKKDDQ